VKKTKLTLESTGLSGVVFTLGKEQKKIGLASLQRMKGFIGRYLYLCEQMLPYIKYYRGFTRKIEKVLDESKKKEERKIEYSVGEDFALFTGDRLDAKSPLNCICDNHTAAKKIKALYEKKYGKSTLQFDTEASYCYVYTKDREEAKRFLLFTYRTIIKPVLDQLKAGRNENHNRRRQQ